MSAVVSLVGNYTVEVAIITKIEYNYNGMTPEDATTTAVAEAQKSLLPGQRVFGSHVKST